MTHDIWHGPNGDYVEDEAPPITLQARLRSSTAAEKRKDEAFEIWKAEPTEGNRIKYDVSLKSWAQTHNRYLDAVAKELGE